MKILMLRAFYLVSFSIFPFISGRCQELPMMMTDEGHIVVEVVLNDSVKGNFILDTGAGVVILSQRMFNRIENSTKKSGFFTGFRHDGDRLDGIIYEVPSVKFGNVNKKDVKVGIYPPLDDYGIDGLLSLKFFEDTPFAIDFENQKISFVPDDQLENLVRENTTVTLKLYKFTDISLDIFIPICLNDNLKVDAEFDTGSGFGAFVINPYFMDALSIDTEKIKSSIYTTPVSGKQLTDQHTALASIGICAEKSTTVLKNVNASFREGLIYEALIGIELFKNKAIVIDIPGRRFIVNE